MQKQLEKYDPSYTKAFQASAKLHNSLSKDYRRNETSSVSNTIFVSTGKELIKQAHLEKQIQNTYKTQISLESEVIALSNYQKPPIREQTRELIAKQKESRRERHIKATKEFEKWVERLTKNIDEAYKDIRQDVIGFFEESDNAINAYYDSLTQDKLLAREIDFIDDLKNIIQDHKKKRDDKVSNLDQRLDELEQERARSLQFFREKYFNNLFEISFILEPEIRQIISQHQQDHESLVKDKKSQNDVYVDSVNQRQKDTFIKYDEMRIQKEQQWRELKHNKYIELFLIDIKKWEYVNPRERVELYQQFKSTQLEIYQQRIQQLQRLTNLEIPGLSKVVVDKWLDEIKQYNTKASTMIDQSFDNLVKESEKTHTAAMDRYNYFADRIYYAGSMEQEKLTELLQNEYLPIVTNINDEARGLMTKAINFIEKFDEQQKDILNNFGAFYLKLGTSNDEYRRQLQVNRHLYEIEKANWADKNDERIELLNNEFQDLKVQLSQALHHPKLDTCLEDCFKKLDQLEAEYRTFHDGNVGIVKKHPDAITKQHKEFEVTIHNFFELLGFDRKPELEFKFKEEIMKKAKYQLSKEEYLKKIEDEKQAEESKGKKGGKPAGKAKDPKKAAQEMEERLTAIIKELGEEEVVEFTSALGQEYVQYKSLEMIVERMYTSQDDQEKLLENEKKQREELLERFQKAQEQEQLKADPKAAKQQQPPAIELPEYNPEQDIPPQPIDKKDEPPQDVEGRVVLSKEVVIEVKFLAGLLGKTKMEFQEYILKRIDDVQEEEKVADKEFLENSILILDDRLKLHYPLKGKTEVEVYQIRASQITLHKKRYERYAKSTFEKLELQTEEINFLIEGALMDMKEYEADQVKLRESLLSAQTLAKFQGIQNTVKENYFKFGEKINEVIRKLEVLGGQELEMIRQRNKDFITESKLFSDGGDYSVEEIEWYEKMMKDIYDSVKKHQENRQKKAEELSQLLQTKKQYQLTSFEKDYAVAVEELAAKDGTGKKYGRPKRLAQERLRTEMTKCEKAQDSINQKLDKLKQMKEEFQQENYELYAKMNPSFTLQLRRLLMSLLTCIRRYATHIEAFKPDAKIQDMPRITYLETKFDTVLEQEEQEHDKKQIELDLETMGPLFYQKDNRKFLEWVADIEKTIKEEATKIYSGEKSKYLTGNDKIPDYLRAYIQQMNKNMDDFKIQSIRDLRNSCDQLSQYSQFISELFFQAIKLKYHYQLDNSCMVIYQEFDQLKKTNEDTKQRHTNKLRPNLGNPQCKDELNELCAAEKDRLTTFIDVIKNFKHKLLETEFEQGNAFFKCIVQNYEFLLLYYDSAVLFEDFVKLPGDEQIQKQHQNLKVSLRQKQNGQIIDTSSERSLTKEWEGFLIDSFKVDDMVIQYQWQPNMPQAQQDPKDAKGGKDKKKGDKKEVEVVQESTTHTKSLKSFKTFRQKSAHHYCIHIFNDFKKMHDKKVAETQKIFEHYNLKELRFEFKWEQMVSSLPIGS